MIAFAFLCLGAAILAALAGFSGIVVVIPPDFFKAMFFVLLVAFVVTFLVGVFRRTS
jgi:hypothetical protein